MATNGKGVQAADSLDQPKLKGQGRGKRTRFSIRRHLHKRGMSHADSVSSVESSEESESKHTHVLLSHLQTSGAPEIIC